MGVSGCSRNSAYSWRRIDPPGGFITGISDLPHLPNRRVLRTGIADRQANMRLFAQKALDVLIEALKDRAIAMYDRPTAMRLADRQRALQK